jgi:uncharacterized protein DUF4274
MTDYISRCAGLRPLMTRDQLNDIFPKDYWTEHRGGGSFGVQYNWGPNAHTAPDGISRENVIESLIFEAPFPASTQIYGFGIGMTLPEAEGDIAKLGLERMEITHPDVRRLVGNTEEGFELTLSFRKDILERVTLAQPNATKIAETRAQFWRARHEEEQRQRELAKSWKLITDDDDAMLMTWAKHCQPWDDYKPSEFVRYAEWLRKADPDQRHAAALTWNWDYSLAPLLWISRRPDCDLATALHIFFGGSPEYYLKIGGDRALVAEGHGDLMTFDMMMDIKSRIERGFYTRSAIQFDLSQAFEILDRHKPTAEQLAALIPNDLPRRHEGRVIAYHNGFGGLDLPAFQID